MRSRPIASGPSYCVRTAALHISGVTDLSSPDTK